MKNSNFPVLLVVIVLVAVLAQFNRQAEDKPERAARQDMEKCLALLWEQEGQQVEITPAGVRATVLMPPSASPRQQRWNYPFLRFVAQRHPELKLQKWEIINGSSQRAIPEVAMHGMLAERWIPPSESEENVSLLTGRRLTVELEKVSGLGSALVLVDAHLTRASLDTPRYGRRASGAPPRPRSAPGRGLSLDICLIVPATLHPRIVQDFQAQQLNHGETIRLVRLPQP